jgi:hypothetical protein
MIQAPMVFHVKPAIIWALVVSVFSHMSATADVNKCTAPNGTVAYSDQPCPSGHGAKSTVLSENPKDKTLAKMSVIEAKAAKEAAGKEFMARYNESMTPECRKFANAMPDRQARNLSKAEQAGRDGFKDSNCDQMVLPAQIWYAETLKKIEAATDKPSNLSSDCKKWAQTMAAIFLRGPRSDAEVEQYKDVSRKFVAQQCDRKQFDEAATSAMAPYKAIGNRLDACQAKQKRLEALRPQRSGMTDSGQKDMLALEKELLRECPEYK